MAFKSSVVLSLFVASVALTSLAWPSGDALARKKETLRVGESKTMYLGKITNVQVGNADIIEVEEHPDGDKIVIRGIYPGYSSLTVGREVIDITVLGDIAALRSDIERLIDEGGIRNVRVLSSGNRVVIDGVVKRRDDWNRINGIVTANKGEVYSLVILDERDIVQRAQVQLHFQVLEVNRNNNHDIGIDWSGGPVRVVLDTMSYIQFGPGAIPDQAGGVRTPDDLLNLRSTSDVRRVLDTDFFTTVSGEEVEFHRGKELVFIAEGFNGQILVKRVGLEIKATPIVDDDGDIDLILEFTFSTTAQEEFGGSVPAIARQYQKAHVQLKAGQSFALSGFFRRENGRVLNGIPGLKDIPGLGVLFGSRSWMKGETDGVVVITPVQIDPDNRRMKKQVKDALDVYDRADVKW